MSGRGPVFVVDDDVDVREALCEVLSDCGFEVSSAGDGLEALAQLGDGLRPRVILLDLMMPRMDGAELRDRLQQDAALAAVPVVMLTADRRGEEGLHTGADAQLEKPVDLDELLRVLNRFC